MHGLKGVNNSIKMQNSETYYYFLTDDNGDIWLMKDIGGRGKGDLLYRMGWYALITGDPDVIKACIRLLNERKRWPDFLNEGIDADSWIERIINRTLKRLGIPPQRYEFRFQGRMTRDSYTTVLAAIYWHQYEMIDQVKIPWYIQTPAFWHWVRYLRTNEAIHKTKFEQWQNRGIDLSIAFKFPAYVKTLIAIRAFITRSDEVKSKLLPFIPEWNLLNRMLCGDEFNDIRIVARYRSREGWYWNSEDGQDDRFLGPDEPFYLDKELLFFIYSNQNFK